MYNKPTLVLFGKEAKKKILEGVKIGYDAVRLTMGPEGKNALMYGTYGRQSRITNDGYTVLESIELKDEFQGLALSELKNAAKKTNGLVGDGTSATTTIAGALYLGAYNLLSEDHGIIGASQSHTGVMTIRKQLLETAAKVEKEVTEKSKKIETLEDLKKIGAISVENEELGGRIAEIAWKVGIGGFVDVIEGFKGEIEIESIEGARFPAKIGAKGFVNNPSQRTMEAKNVAVLLTNYDLENVSQLADVIVPILKKTPNLAILAPNFSKDVLDDLWKASYSLLPGGVRQKTNMEIYPIRVPSLRTEQFEDLEVYFGARFIDKNKGIKLLNVRQEDLGFAAKIVVKDTDTRDDAIALGGGGSMDKDSDVAGKPIKVEAPVKARMRVLEDQIKETKEESHKNLLRRRIAGLGSAVGVVRVGSPSDSETYYLKKKIEDAVYACKAALEEGYVKGGGLCLKEIAETLPDDNLLKNALLQPYKQIQENAGGNLEIGENVIDPAKAIRLAVRHAVSVVAHLITVGVMIPEEREKSPAEGYEAIAEALNLSTAYYARWRGIIKENDEEITKDTMADHDAKLRQILD